MRLNHLPLLGLLSLTAPAFAITVNISGFSQGSPDSLTTAGTVAYSGEAGEFGGLLGGQSFTAYCAQLTQDFFLNTTYDYAMVSTASYFSGQKADDLSRLFTAAQSFVVDSKTSAAMQAAVWEVIYQSGDSYDLTRGDFTVAAQNSSDAATMAALAAVNGFLVNLSSYSASTSLSMLTNPDRQDFITTSVPEPQTWALLVAGLGVVGALARRRR